MGWALVSGQSAHASASGTGSVSAALPSNPTQGNAVCVIINANSTPTLTSIQDGNLNNLTLSPSSPSGTTNKIWAAWYFAPANGNKTFKATFSGTPTNSDIFVREFSFTGGVPAFDTDIAAASSSNGTAINTPSYTPQHGNTGELVVGGVFAGATITSVNSPWTGSISANGNADCYDLSVSSATAMNMTQSSSSSWRGILMGFYLRGDAQDGDPGAQPLAQSTPQLVDDAGLLPSIRVIDNDEAPQLPRAALFIEDEGAPGLVVAAPVTPTVVQMSDELQPAIAVLLPSDDETAIAAHVHAPRDAEEILPASQKMVQLDEEATGLIVTPPPAAPVLSIDAEEIFPAVLMLPREEDVVAAGAATTVATDTGADDGRPAPAPVMQLQEDHTPTAPTISVDGAQEFTLQVPQRIFPEEESSVSAFVPFVAGDEEPRPAAPFLIFEPVDADHGEPLRPFALESETQFGPAPAFAGMTALWEDFFTFFVPRGITFATYKSLTIKPAHTLSLATKPAHSWSMRAAAAHVAQAKAVPAHMVAALSVGAAHRLQIRLVQ